MEVMIEKIIDPDHILHDIKTSHRDSIKAFLKNVWYDVIIGLMSIGFLPEESDEGVSMDEYIRTIGYWRWFEWSRVHLHHSHSLTEITVLPEFPSEELKNI